MNAEKMNPPTDETRADNANANTTADEAALVARGNSSGGVRDASEPVPLSMMPIADLLDHAERGIGLAELASDALLTSGDGMAMLGHCHHALFCQRVDTVEHAQRRDAFHERLHTLRQRVSEAKQAQEAETATAFAFDAEEARRHLASGAPDLAERVAADRQLSIVALERRIFALESLGLPRIAADAEGFSGELSYMRECGGHADERLAELERGAEMYQRKLDGLAERVFSMEVPLDRLAKLEARVLALDGINVVDNAGNIVRREPPNRYLLNTSIVHITSEAEMVEAFGEGRGQAMWAECEARKSGGAK